MNRAVRAAFWTAPSIFCLWLYWYGLKAWFQQDDFAWLGLHSHVYDWPSFLDQMFSPMAQGTIRPWSERGFFLLFYKFFGADALPYRIFVFATQVANLLLISWIVLRLTGSRIAAFAAPILWTANASLATAMAWTSDYNEILCAFFLLSAFALYLHGRYWLQLLVFVLGFGALELNVVYPAIVLAYVVTCDPGRRAILRTLPLFAISIAYYALHSWAAPGPASGPYALHLDTRLLQTFGTYLQWTFLTMKWKHAHWVALAFAMVFASLLLWHAVRKARKRDFLPLFFLLWFLVSLAPFLPLRDHMTDYYLIVPTIGLSMLAAQAAAEVARESGRTFRLVAAIPVCATVLYLFLQTPTARADTRWYFDRSREVRDLVLGVRRARQLHPGKAILLTDFSPNLYALALADSPFPALDIPEVYLASESARKIPADSTLPDVNQFVLPPGAAARGVLDGRVVVYSAFGGHLRNVTSVYELSAAPVLEKNFPRRVDVGVALLGYLLGSTWYPLEVDHRWMPDRASVRMGGPRTISDKLILSGYCPEEQVRAGTLRLRVSVDGKGLAETDFTKPETPFSRSFDLPADLVGKDYVDVTLEVNRTFQARPGERKLGLAFGVLEIR